VSENLDQTGMSTAKGGVTRRSWSAAQKRRIVEEAYRPGASVADIARSHGLNANQVFNWRRRSIAAAAPKAKNASLSAALMPQGEISAAAATFLAIGTTAPADDAGALLVSPPTASGIGRAVPKGPSSANLGSAGLGSAGLGSAGLGSAGQGMEDRAGLIEIDLACGTRLRVDAFVNERALRRILSVLKASP